MVYVGASAVIVQSMLSGSSNVAGFGGPAVITNVLRGGDIIQVAAMAPYFTQSLFVRPDIRDLRSLQGKKIGITRFGSVTDFALRTIIERHNIKEVNILQMGGFPEAVAGLSRGAIDGAVFSPPHNFRMLKEGFRELVSQKDLRALGQRISHPRDRRAEILCRDAPRRHRAADQIHGRGHEIRIDSTKTRPSGSLANISASPTANFYARAIFMSLKLSLASLSSRKARCRQWCSAWSRSI